MEVLVASLLLALAMLPVVDLLGQSHRIAHLAKGQVVASTEAQSVLDGLTSLTPKDFPPSALAPGGTVLLQDGQGSPSGSERWNRFVSYFEEHRQEGVVRTVRSVAMGPDKVLIQVVVRWTRLPDRPETESELVLVGLSVGP